MKSSIDAIIRGEQARYLDGLLPFRDPLLLEIEAYAEEHRQPIADPEVAQLMRVLVQARPPKHVLEIGTNIGYSVIVLGREMQDGSTIETIEIDAATLDVATDFVRRAELKSEIVFHQGPALDVLPELEGTFDFVFIDCVKTEYSQYLDLILPQLDKGGLVVFDNLLWKGEVAKGDRSPEPVALAELNKRIMTDPELVSIVLPLSDGVGISVKV
ncbi:MAG: O-methyltransferase [Thermoanaerobaculia bacterium]|nr:O-methyltransferase [Thermoanaerobaculia bacterium]